MNIQEYITSGILELYATGALPTQENAEVERMYALYPEVKNELDTITATLEAYAEIHAVTPPSALKETILQHIKQLPRPGINPELADNQQPLPEAKQIYLPTTPQTSVSSQRFNWMAVAAAVLLLISAIFNVVFYNRWQGAENRYQVAVSTQQQYAQNLRQVKSELNLRSTELALITDTQTQQIKLQGVKKSPASEALVYWNRNTKEVYIKLTELPAPPAGTQYQLWALNNGKPIDAGLVAVNMPPDSLQKMKIIEQAQAFAITLEPQGGSMNPTLDQMYVMGQI